MNHYSSFKKLFVFTLQSIKSRIETKTSQALPVLVFSFLLYSPLNQGLKLINSGIGLIQRSVFLLYSPLNQGLKQDGTVISDDDIIKFLLYSPLNQGLKLGVGIRLLQLFDCFYSTVH